MIFYCLELILMDTYIPLYFLLNRIYLDLVSALYFSATLLVVKKMILPIYYFFQISLPVHQDFLKELYTPKKKTTTMLEWWILYQRRIVIQAIHVALGIKTQEK